MSRRESVARPARTQSASGPPIMRTVTVAVLPPRLPQTMAPPTGIGMADTFNWDESINWSHNRPIPKEGEQERRKSIFKKVGLTTERKKRNPDLPPFIMRQVPYETWRKHYAKDKDGKYRGTHAPAEDCLLLPDDVMKWNIGDPETYADKWTRGKEALPVYAEVREHGMVPEYEVDYDGPPREGAPPPPEEPIVTADEDELASHLERRDTAAQDRREQTAALEVYERQQTQREAVGETQREAVGETQQGSGRTIDGKTTAQIIAEAQKRGKQKEGWKTMLRRGAEMASFGG